MGFFNTEERKVPRPNYEYITKTSEAEEALAFIEGFDTIEVDTEGTSLSPFDGKITLLQLGIPGKAFVFDVRNDTEYSDIDFNIFKPLLTNKNKLKILQYAVYDMKMIKHHYGFYLENIYDTMVAEQIISLGLNPKANLASLVKKYLGLKMDKEPRGTFKEYNQAFKPFQLEYAALDVCVLSMIREMQLLDIEKYALEGICSLEFKFIKALCEMELNGITIDVDKWRKIMADVEIEKEKTGQAISKVLDAQEDQITLFGASIVNIDSPAQLKKALNKFGLPIEGTSEEELKKYEGLELIDDILAYRKAGKLISTYAEPLLDKIHPVTGRLHTAFKQLVSTGRLSSANPNLQNIPGKQKYRTCFIAEQGKALVTADMSGAELRILGNLSLDPVFVSCYLNGIDVHTKSASGTFNVEYKMVTKEQRKASKAITFGLCLKHDTVLFTDSGQITIKEVKLGNHTSHDIGCDEIIDKKHMGIKPCYKITTKYGYELECTADHMIKVIDWSGNYVDKKVADLDKTVDYVCLKSGSNNFSEQPFIFDTFATTKNTNYKHLNLPKTLDSNIAALLGLFVSEGSLLKVRDRETYSLFSVDLSYNPDGGEFLNRTRELFNNVFGERFSEVPVSENRVRFSVNSVLFGEWLISLFNTVNVKNKDIHIPDCIKRSPKHIQAEFLSWLFEGDGTHKRNGNGCKIAYSSKSLPLIKDVQLVLLNFGILSSITEEIRKEFPGELYYNLSVIGEDSYTVFMKNIGFVTDTKTNNCSSKDRFFVSSYSIPHQTKRLKAINGNYDDVHNCLVNRVGKVGNIIIQRLKKGDLSGFFKFIDDNGIITLPIKSVEYIGEHEVYDVSVNNRELLLANGFVVHNCYGLSKVGLARRLRISEKKAAKLMDNYFKMFPKIKAWLDGVAEEAVRKGYSETIAGRKRFYNIPRQGDPERGKVVNAIKRQAKNAPIQGCLVFDSKISGLGNIGKYAGKDVILETGQGLDRAVGVYSGKKDVYALKLSNGSSLGITLEHKIPVLTNEGLAEKAVENINLNDDYLLIPLNTIEGKVTDVSGFIYEKGHWRETYKDFNLPETMSKELSFVVGSLLGDGNYSSYNNFSFVCQEPQVELFNKFIECINNVFGYNPKVSKLTKDRNTALYKAQISSVVIRGFLEHIGLDYVTGKSKKVPECFYTETIENKGALLNGLFSTDGGMTRESGPNYTTISKQLAIDVQCLLFSLGINANLKSYVENKVTVYRIQIPKRFNGKFKKYVGFSVGVKNGLLDYESCTPKCGDGSVVPEFIPKLIEKTLRNSSTYFSDFTAQEKAHLRRFKLGKCSFSSWRKFYERLPECTEKKYLAQFLNFDFCKAVSLTYRGEEDTYDLMCDNIHYFIANGVIVHNSNADTIKQAMIFLVERLEKLDYYAKLILTVHDELIVECDFDKRYEIADILAQAIKDGFDMYFDTIKMETDALIGPCWLKGACENKEIEDDCGGTEFEFLPDEKYGTKLVCKKCGKGY